MIPYDDLRRKIIETLDGRPAGHEILPIEHQDFALALADWIRDVELISASTLVGYATANTTPTQSNLCNETYISTIPNSTTITFNNFRGADGLPITVTTPNDYAAFIVLLWNKQYWQAVVTQIHISAIADLSEILKKLKILPEEEFTTNVTCGGIPAGTFIARDTELKTLIKNMLFMYIAPTLVIGGGGNYEVGTTQNPTITYKGTNSTSANVSKIVLTKTVSGAESELETRDPAVSGTEYSYNDTGITAETTYTAKLYDNVRGESTVAVQQSASIKFWRKFFWGYAAQGGLPTTSAAVRALANSGFVTITSGSQVLQSARTEATSYYLVLAVPTGYHMYVENEFGSVINPIEGAQVQVNIGGGVSEQTLTYKTYYIEGTPIFKNLKLVKD